MEHLAVEAERFDLIHEAPEERQVVAILGLDELGSGRDLLLVQYDHLLMDINGTKLLLREIQSRFTSGIPPKAWRATRHERELPILRFSLILPSSVPRKI